MNENFGHLKARLKKLDGMLVGETGRILANLDLARAVSQAHRLLRDSHRTREPSPAARAAVEKAEILSRTVQSE
jgi:hypothetical protein